MYGGEKRKIAHDTGADSHRGYCLSEQPTPKVGQGSLYQEPYRMQLFTLFAEAYNQGLIINGALVAEKVRDSAIERWLTHDQEEDKKRLPYINKLHMAWFEWQYAWQHSAMKSHSHSAPAHRIASVCAITG